MPTRKDRPTRPPEPPHRADGGAVGTDQQGPVSAPAAPHMLAPSRPLTPIVGFFAEHDGILGRMSNGHSFAGAGSDLGSRRATRTRPRGRSGHLRRRFGFGTLAAAALIAFPLAASAAPSVQITEANASDPELGTPNQIAQTLLGPDVELDGDATINGSSDPAQYNPRLSAFGRFTDGADDVGIDDGLIFGANMNADYFRTGLGGTVATSVADDDLFNVVNADGLCTPYTTAATCVHSATSIEFSVRPTSRYIKFEYALAVTEYGTFSSGSSTWDGAMFMFPDGFGLFVGGRSVAHNCAVVPQTSTYLTMSTAGIVPPLVDAAASRASAQARLDARIANPAAPNGFAYKTDSGWPVQFITVPLTCVADVNDAFVAGDPANIKIVIANIKDEVASPAVFLQGGSVRFSDDSTPAPTPTPTAPDAPSAPQATAGNGSATVTWTAPGGDGGAAISGYTVTSAPGGKTCVATAPETSCTITGLTNGTDYTFTVVATNSAGDSAPSAASASVTPTAPPPPPPPPPAPVDPPADTTPAPVDPPADTTPSPAPPAAPPAPTPTPPAPPIATPITPPVSRPGGPSAGEGATRMVHRLQFDQVGRYTFIYINRATGKRITQLRGSRIGKRTIGRRVSAPVLNNQKAGKRLVVNSLLAKRAMPKKPGQVALRIVLRRPDGTLSAVMLGSDGSLVPTAIGPGGR